MNHSLFFALSLLSAGYAAADATQSTTQQQVEQQSTDRLIVKYRTAPTANGQQASISPRAEALAASKGLVLTVLRQTATGAVIVQTQRALTFAEMRTLGQDIMRDDQSVEFAEPDVRVTFGAIGGGPGNPDLVNDPMALDGTQWAVSKSHPFHSYAQFAWHYSTGKGARVAVLDTGYLQHSELDSSRLQGADMVSRDMEAYDDASASVRGGSHGTGVATIIAGAANNGEGIAGLAFDAKIIPVRVLGGWFGDLADGIIWAAGGNVPNMPKNTNPAHVINMSLGAQWRTCFKNVQQAIDYANSQKVIVVAAAGNDGIDAYNFTPANCSGVVTVGSYGKTGQISGFSNYGNKVTVLAPGEDIWSVWTERSWAAGTDGFGTSYGTSVAAPHVAATAALAKALRPDMSPEHFYYTLKRTAIKDIDCSSRGCSTGRLNSLATVTTTMNGDFEKIQFYPFCRVEWDGNDTYSEGSTVSLNGHNYRARWWIANTPPDVNNQFGAWQDLGQCGTTHANGNVDPDPQPVCKDAWNGSASYSGGNEVSRNGKNYAAKWWTQGQDPATSGQHGPWNELGACRS
ncbi:S8 family peptidase [Chitinibacteraceae bacterium HSL-7]